MHCPANVIMMVADVLAPNRRPCIANHHRDTSSISRFTSSHQHNIQIPLRPLNKQYLRQVGSSATCCWQWVRLLTRITPYFQSMLSTYNSHSLHCDSTLVDRIIVFETNFVSSLAIIQDSSLFLTITLGKIKWRFSSCSCFIFSLSSWCSCDILFQAVVHICGHRFNVGFWLFIYPVFCVAWAELGEDK